MARTIITDLKSEKILSVTVDIEFDGTDFDSLHSKSILLIKLTNYIKDYLDSLGSGKFLHKNLSEMSYLLNVK
jgi:hypothetical protein